MARRTGFTDSALLRSLARLADNGLRDTPLATADQWSQWLGWTDAIALAAALNGHPAFTHTGTQTPASAEEADCTRVRAELGAAIDGDVARTTDFASYRRRHLARQQAMEAAIAALRARLRAALAARSPDAARLAAVDVVMEQALSPREHNLLGGVSALLEKHFVRLRRADQPEADDGSPGPDAAASAMPRTPWLDVFHKGFQDVLQAELDFRFQPIEGLRETLRMRQETTREP